MDSLIPKSPKIDPGQPAAQPEWSWLQGSEPLRLRFASALLWLSQLRRRERRFLLRRLRVAPLVLALLAAMLGAPHLVRAEVTGNTIPVTAGSAGRSIDNKCSLTEAIINANNGNQTYADCVAGTAGLDTIVLPANATFGYDAAFPSTDNALPVVTTPIIIQGSGGAVLRNMDSSLPSFRLFEVGAAGDLTLNNLQITGGKVSLANQDGGGILNAGKLTLNNCSLSVNQSLDSAGGGIASSGNLVVSQSAITLNSSKNYGGGIYISAGTFDLSHSTLSENSSDFGGGIASDGTLSVRQSTISGNIASTFGGGVYASAGTFDLSQSTVNANTATYGGGVAAFNSSMTLTNSTLSGNSVTNKGGGAAMYYATASISNTTITGNTASGGIASTFGGGMASLAHVDLTISRSLVSGNAADGGREVWINSEAGNTTVSSGHSVLGRSGEVDAAAFDGFAPAGNDIDATSDGLNVPLSSILNTTLALNGSAWVHALVAGSPAIDAAPAAACQGAPTNGVDERGVLRLSGAGNTCDAGSYEFYTSTAVEAAGFASRAQPDGLQLSWWADASGGGLSGFQLRRSLHGANNFSDLPSGFVPADPSALGGKEYTFLDTSLQGGLQYDYELAPLGSAGQPIGPALQLSASFQRIFLPRISH